jgi:MFS family permease
LLPLRLFRSRGFSAGNATIFFESASLTGAVFFMAQFLQVSQGLGPLDAGLRLLPLGLTPFLVGPLSGAMADRIAGRTLIISGLALQTAGLAGIAALAGPAVAYWALLGPMVMIGLGVALALPAMTKSVVGSVALTDVGKAAGAFTTLRQLGGAFGVAIPAAVFAAAGSYASPSTFSRGFTAAIAITAVLGLAGTAASLVLPGRRPVSAEPPTRPLADRESVDGGQLDGAQREAEQVEVGEDSLRAL